MSGPGRLASYLRNGLPVPEGPATRERLFGEIAVELGYVSESQLKECLEQQAEGQREGRVWELGQILIQKKQLTGDKKQTYRLDHSKPVVDGFFAWCEEQLTDKSLLPDNPLIKAIGYIRNRQTELRVFLEDPDVPLDTNHLERALRPIPMGRHNWKFCWTELGAEHVGIIQSLICTCKIQGVDPYDYLVDVLQRISSHPANDVISLTPRVWKEKFAHAPMRSDLHQKVNNCLE